MPIYEYQCKHCGHRLEAMQKMAEAPLQDCPQCGKAGLRKLVSAAGFQLKGGGWYATDFKDSGKKKPADKPASDSGSAAGDKADGGRADGGKATQQPAEGSGPKE